MREPDPKTPAKPLGRERDPGAAVEGAALDPWDRRTFLKRGAVAAGAAFFATPRRTGKRAVSHLTGGLRAASAGSPNILTILVDQLRWPVWMPPNCELQSIMPNLAALAAQSVSFERHYTASTDCSPSRSVLLTGLYTHQTGVLVTGSGWLDPRFPTWGTLLRTMGYETAYYGKWHLNPNAYTSLEQYGFSGGTYPSPNGSPGQGTDLDPSITDQFVEWFTEKSDKEPWAATVSFVNPHDLAWWHSYTEKIASEASPPSRAVALPPNFETPEQLAEKGKPPLQRSLQEQMAQSFGEVPFTGSEALGWWMQMMDTYLLLQSYVDVQIGTVIQTLASKPEEAANTIVIFTSDHGEYCGSHGMRGKGASAYEEAIRVPLYVYDPRGVATASPDVPRTQLTSSADVVALMLTLASGSSEWREEPEYSHLASRWDLASICGDPAALGRKWVLHATDEDVQEFAANPYNADAPRHVVAIRSATGKLALYSNWRSGTIEAESSGQEVEFYDYASEEGALELSPQTGASSALREELLVALEEEGIPQELRAPLPSRLREAHREGMKQYLSFDARESVKVAEAHQPGTTNPAPEAL